MKQIFTVKIAFSVTLYAGFFGMFDIFDTVEQPLPEQPVYNSQTVPLLESAPSLYAQAAIGGAEIIIVDDSALYPETGNGTSVSVTPALFSKNHNGKISTYVVQEGDTISQIAEMFGVTTNTIRWGNDIDTNDVIQPGERLVILPINGVRHTVQDGETIQSIAKKYEGDVDEILRYNEFVEGVSLAAGDVVVIPNGEVRAPQVTPKRTSGGSYAKASVREGYFINPVPGSVVTQGLHGHNAIDLGAPIGTPIYAAAAGEVIVSKQGGWNGGYGNYVVVKHSNGTQTMYSHNTENLVYVGQYVEQGEMIGTIGSTGRATGPHLHFEVRGSKNPLDH